MEKQKRSPSSAPATSSFGNLSQLFRPLTGVEKAAIQFFWKLGYKSIDDVTWPESSASVEPLSKNSHVDAIFNTRKSDQRRTFLFRAYYVPLFCRCLIRWRLKLDGQPRFWLWEYATYALGYQRMLIEIYLRRGFRNPPPPIRTLLENPPEGYQYWLRRFGEWREAAEASYRHFIGKQCPEIRNSKHPNAAHLATLYRLSEGLPEEVFGEMMKRNRSEDELIVFDKALKRKHPARWGEPNLDTWLIEIWPLVTEYGWNYHDVWSTIHEKFNVDDADTSLDSASAIRERCRKMLKLKLSPKGQAKQGRPKECALPRFAILALFCDSIGFAEELWIQGQLVDES